MPKLYLQLSALNADGQLNCSPKRTRIQPTGRAKPIKKARNTPGSIWPR